MTPTEIQQYQQTIAATDTVDDWARIDRELRARPDAATPEVRELLRAVERKSAGLVQNAIMRTLASDADGYDIEAFEELMMEAPDVDPENAQEVLQASAWMMTRMAGLLQDQPGRFQEMRRRMMQRGMDGVEFSFSDLMADEDMSLALREAEMVRDNIREWAASFEAAVAHEGSAIFQEHMNAIVVAMEGEGEELDEAIDVMNEDIDAGLVPGEDVPHLWAIATWAAEQPTVKGWFKNNDIAEAVQALQDEIGTEQMRMIAANPMAPQAQATLARLLGRLGGEDPHQNRRIGRGRGF